MKNYSTRSELYHDELYNLLKHSDINNVSLCHIAKTHNIPTTTLYRYVNTILPLCDIDLYKRVKGNIRVYRRLEGSKGGYYGV